MVMLSPPTHQRRTLVYSLITIYYLTLVLSLPIKFFPILGEWTNGLAEVCALRVLLILKWFNSCHVIFLLPGGKSTPGWESLLYSDAHHLYVTLVWNHRATCHLPLASCHLLRATCHLGVKAAYSYSSLFQLFHCYSYRLYYNYQAYSYFHRFI